VYEYYESCHCTVTTCWIEQKATWLLPIATTQKKKKKNLLNGTGRIIFLESNPPKTSFHISSNPRKYYCRFNNYSGNMLENLNCFWKNLNSSRKTTKKDTGQKTINWLPVEHQSLETDTCCLCSYIQNLVCRKVEKICFPSPPPLAYLLVASND